MKELVETGRGARVWVWPWSGGEGGGGGYRRIGWGGRGGDLKLLRGFALHPTKS